ncbi:hypothetical protein [Desulfobacula sp.]|uniref:hypothetical protein n=1 Tax=Desulfobacula sp. TaxID=2593537 RepID=UPI0026296335|nr:hypothetical protein [Desulfobacula sp.]
MEKEVKETPPEENKILSQEAEDSLKALEVFLRENFPLGIPRTKIGNATGGMFHPRTMANLDCQKCGIPGRFKIGRQTIYPIAGTLEYLRKKIVCTEA